MAQQNLMKLASQGRAYDASRAWTEEELASLIALETGRGLARNVAADLIRNGISTVEDYDRAVEVGFKPKSLEDLRTDAIRAHSEKVRKELGLDSAEEEVETKDEEVAETDEVKAPEGVLETDEVPETQSEVETETEVAEKPSRAVRGRNTATKTK